MRLYEVLTESKNRPCVVVDIQPEYTGINDGNELPWIDDLMTFLNDKNKILAFINAEDTGLTMDIVDGVKEYWKDSGFTNLKNTKFVDKGYGYLRSWMDEGISPKMIIKTIRLLYQEKLSDSRELFGSEDDPDYEEKFRKFFEDNNEPFEDFVLDDSINVNWINIQELKNFNNCYIMGGGENECLREVELIMNAFNIKYKRIQQFVY